MIGTKKVYILIGNFGSGKTELALNFAFDAAKLGKTLLLDIDMVNTYFRLSERRKLIGTAGIELVSVNYTSTNIETMSLPAQVSSAFHMDWDTVVFDVGGDGVGATALGRYKEEFDALPEGALEVLKVVNIRRPMSGTPEKIISLMENIEKNSRLMITGLINNTNLAGMTGWEELESGYEVLREVSEKTGVPVRYTSGKKEMLDIFCTRSHDPAFVGDLMEITTYMHRDWETFTRFGV